MFSEAIQFTKSKLDEFISRKGGSSTSILRLGSLAGANGSGSDSSGSNHINLSIVNIESAESMAHRMPKAEVDGKFIKTNPPVYMNVYLLFSMDFKRDNYLDGLHWLSLIVLFFQQHTTFSASTSSMPEGIDRLNFELTNIEIDNMSRFWGALGANYQPSVIYKMRMIMFDGRVKEAEQAGIQEPQANAGL